MAFPLIILHKINFINIYSMYKNPSHALFVTISCYFLGYVYNFTNNYFSKHICFLGSWNLIFDCNSNKLVFISSFEHCSFSYYFKIKKKVIQYFTGVKLLKSKKKMDLLLPSSPLPEHILGFGLDIRLKVMLML